jgi:hypothetical protein
MAGIKVDMSAFENGMRALDGRVKRAARDGMHDAMDDLLRRSRDLAPLRKGTLRQTSWSEVETQGDSVIGEVYYSAVEDGKGGRFNYALKLHEMGEYKNPTTPGTQPKYLERPLKENAENYVEDIARKIREEL